jgi:hypothetical protein
MGSNWWSPKLSLLLIGLQQVEALNHHQETGNVSVNEKKNQLIDMRPIIYDI